ncbi:hypothetical protein [Actinomadura decatromicini]|uniref:Uncharacterized protein n=1 Tax=Actinomadura decatromicini TaxID=2604572 RepID=A0A5D3F8F8_9ACTN|nr:hypothetical protein [Actinomadura decatromicini]TYK44493.1 hypothetical protein FXF68_34045 [Actinomadura decatromicini]
MGIGRWRAERLVRLAAEQGGTARLDALARRAAAGGPELALLVAVAVRDEHRAHPLRAWARDLIPRAWARRRDPRLRAVVRRHGLLPDGGPARRTVAALHGRLLEHWDDGAERAVPALLTDPDPDVREGARHACGAASEPVLGALWRAAAEASGDDRRALLDALPRNPRPLAGATLAHAWRCWIDGPTPELWARLRETGREAPGDDEVRRLSALALGTAAPDELCRAVLADRTPEHVRRLVARTCAERGLVPDEELERAAFLLLSGRRSEYRAADPDGGLLAVAYAGGSAGLRARMRSAVAGDLDLVRVLAATAPPRTMSVRERGFLAGRLAAEEAWPDLWRLARDLPLAEVIEAVRPVRGWCPPGMPRDAFDRLRAMPSDRVRAALSAFDLRGPLRPVHDITVVERCALSPDGTRLAVTGRSRTTGAQVLIDYALPGGTVVASYSSEGRTEQWRSLVHTGEEVIAIVGHPAGRLVRYRDGERHCLIDPPHIPGHVRDDICAAVLAPGGTLAAASLRDLHLFAPPYDGTRRTVRFADLGLAEVWGFALAVEPRTGLIAVGGPAPAVLDARAEALVARGDGDRNRTEGVVFTGPDRLVTTGMSGDLIRWRLADGALRPEASRTYGSGGPDLTSLPAHGRIWARSGDVYVDADTLRESGPPDGSRPDRLSVWATPSGRHFAVAGLDGLDVHGPYRDAAARLLDRPLADLVPGDLDRADALLASGRYDGDAAELLTLLRVCLEERYGTEVALGPATSVATETDIALSVD